MPKPRKSKFTYDSSDSSVSLKQKSIRYSLQSLENILQSLYQYKDTLIRDLGREQKEQFYNLVNFVQILYGTQYYQKLSDMVEKIFSDVTAIKPGTVGTYIMGCVLSKRFSENTTAQDVWYCSPFCLDAIPVNNQPECNYTVITLIPSQDSGYQFELNKFTTKDNNDKAVIFTEHPFLGFTPSEKNKLKDFGITQIRVYYITPQGFSDIITEWTSIDKIPTVTPEEIRKANSTIGQNNGYGQDNRYGQNNGYVMPQGHSIVRGESNENNGQEMHTSIDPPPPSLPSFPFGITGSGIGIDLIVGIVVAVLLLAIIILSLFFIYRSMRPAKPKSNGITRSYAMEI
jgi:hypothetical protein